MEFWFSRSGHWVKVVVLAKFEHRRRRIVFGGGSGGEGREIGCYGDKGLCFFASCDAVPADVAAANYD
jgi:hypothetical protein